MFCVFARKRSEKQKNRRRRVRADDGFETSRLGASETVTDDEEDAANHRVVTNPDDDLAPVPPMIQPQCAFLDADDVPGLDALRAAVADTFKCGAQFSAIRRNSAAQISDAARTLLSGTTPNASPAASG